LIYDALILTVAIRITEWLELLVQGEVVLGHRAVIEIRDRRQLASLSTCSLDIGPALPCKLGPLGDPRSLGLLITQFTKCFLTQRASHDWGCLDDPFEMRSRLLLLESIPRSIL
jgi:hypothetical protein